jgi:hypothetical protein
MNLKLMIAVVSLLSSAAAAAFDLGKLLEERLNQESARTSRSEAQPYRAAPAQGAASARRRPTEN